MARLTGVLAALLFAAAPGIARAQALPDLVPEVSDVHLAFGASVLAGDVAEGCASATEGIDLLRLALTTSNVGAGDLTLGNPGCPFCTTNPGAVCADPAFVCSPAGGHNHPHYRNFLRYELIDAHGAQVGLGGKRSFCLAESGCSGPAIRHTCTNQGLAAGCWDIYPSYLGCQYIEITGVPSGEYTLRVTVDPGSEIAESDETNNVVEQPVVIARAEDLEVGLEGGSLLIADGKRLRLHARRVPTDAPVFLGGEPTAEGAVLRVADLDGHLELELPLPAEGWKALGRRSVFAYLYRGAGSDADPCRTVLVTANFVRADCGGRAIDLALPVEGDVFVQLALGEGGQRYCATFGGRTRLNNERLLIRHDPPASTCSAFHH